MYNPRQIKDRMSFYQKMFPINNEGISRAEIPMDTKILEYVRNDRNDQNLCIY